MSIATQIQSAFAGFTTFVQRATTWSETRINAFFTKVTADISYVTQFFVHEGPVLIAAAGEVLTDIEVAAVALPGIPELGAAAAGLKTAITVFENIVTGLTQAGQQPSSTAAQSIMASPDLRSVLKQARTAQAAVDTAKARAAALLVSHGK